VEFGEVYVGAASFAAGAGTHAELRRGLK
jgi:hypothetical protein